MTRNPEAIAERIAADIAAGRYAVGSLLPGERPLCEALQVGRPLLREAIRLLVAQGLVETRHGQGTRVVADRSRPLRGAFASVLPGGHADAGHLLELRLAIETAIAAAAASRRSAMDLVELEGILSAAAICTEIEMAADFDVRFHARLAQASGNPLFALTLKSLAGLLQQDRPAGLAGIGAAAALADHRAIVGAVRDGRPAAAAAAMRRHLKRVAASMPVRTISGRRAPDGSGGRGGRGSSTPDRRRC